MAIVHLVCGRVGAGKTTRAHELAASSGGVVFTIDDWLVTLFAADAVGVVQTSWVQPRLERCERQIWKLARRLLALGVDVILDLGFMRREHRDLHRRLAAEAGVATRLHEVTAEAEVRRARVKERNRTRGPTFSIEVSDPQFDWVETQYQPPGEDEV